MTATEADQALGAYIQSLRLQAGLAPDVLARRMSLSQAQLAQLENGEGSLFYTRRIRQQAARKVILHLGGDVARASNEALPDAVQVGPSLTAPLELAPPSPVSAQASASAQSLPMTPSAATGTASMHDRAMALPSALSRQPLAALPPMPPPARPTRLRPVWVLALAGLAGLPLVPLGVRLWPTEAATARPVPAPQSPSPVALAQASESVPPLALPAEALRAPRVAESPAAPACPMGSTPLPTVQPQQASKPGNMVYVVSPVRLQVCLTDARGEVQVSHLEAGQGRSFYGQPPWQVHSPELQRLEMYFQGWRVRLPAQAQDAVQLVELR